MLRVVTRQLTSLASFAEARATCSLLNVDHATSRFLVPPFLCSQQIAALSSSPHFKHDLFNTQPRSLDYIRGGWAPAEGVEHSFLKRNLLRLFGFYSQEAQLMRGAQGLYSCITEAVDDKRLLAALELPDDFHYMHSLLCLHVWLLLTRLRPEGKIGKKLSQMLYDNFQDDVESRVRAAGVKVRVSKQLVDLEKQFYGSSFAYDKALKGDGSEDLATALHRNVYQKEASKREAAGLLARYVKRELACLSMTPTDSIFRGNVRLSALHLLPEDGCTTGEREQQKKEEGVGFPAGV